ncbi:MAG: hypothetical protein M3552_18665, partial [Planctomycetota bacterium]|nr:hypothetical protein [Planctomycetota bacterium]
MIRLSQLTALLLAALIAVPARGADASIDRVEVGFGGRYKAGQWMPLAVTVQRDADSTRPLVLETVTADAEGSAVIQSLGSVETSGSHGIIRGVIQAGRLGSDLTLRIRDADGAILVERRLRAGSLPTAVPKGEKLWVMAGGLNEVSGEGVEPTLPVPAGVLAAPLSEPLPESDDAYTAADVLFARGDFAPQGQQAEAIRRWVAGGGHLVIALGRFTDTFRDGPLAEWTPIEVGETVQLRDLSQLEAFSGSDRRLPARARVRAARLGDSAEVLAYGADGPLIARSPYGFGIVTLFAIDLDDVPFSTWAGRPNLIRKAILRNEPTKAKGRRIIAPGVSDIATQLARSDDSFPNVERPTVGAALILLIVYAAVVGPLDYLLVHRVLKRPALTWITLPLLVAASGWWLHAAAANANGTTSRFNQTDILDIDATTGTVRGRTAVTLYTVESAVSDVVIAPTGVESSRQEESAPRVAWFTPPEATFGGTYREASGGLFRPEYALRSSAESASAEAVPQLVWASRRFVATWQRGDGADLVTSDLVTRGRGVLEGTITHTLDRPLLDYVVVFGDRIFVNPHESQWHPGEPIDLASAAFDRNDLDSYLRRRMTTRIEREAGESGAEFLVTDTAYDPLETDIGAILRMLTFHEATGGSAYTGLANDVLGSHDLTHLVDMGRAIVLGRLDAPASEVTVDAKSGGPFEPARKSTFVRLVLPVTLDESNVPITLPTFDGETAEAPTES